MLASAQALSGATPAARLGLRLQLQWEWAVGMTAAVAAAAVRD